MSLSLDIPILETERLRLRAWREEDLEPYARFCASEATARFVGGPCDRDNAWRRIAMLVGHWTLRGYGYWALEDKASGQFVGYSGLWSPQGWPEPEVGWGLVQDFHGRGYATEAARRARDFAYRELRWSTAVSYIVSQNVASRRVANRLGAAFERDIELRGHPAGVYRHPGPGALHS